MRRRQNNKKPTSPKVSTHNKLHKEMGTDKWRATLMELIQKTDSIRVNISTNLVEAQTLINSTDDCIRSLERSTEDSNPITIMININSLEKHTQALESIFNIFASLVKDISSLETQMEANYAEVRSIFGGTDPSYEEYKQFSAERPRRYQTNLDTISSAIRKQREAITEYSPLKGKSLQTIGKKKEKKLILDKKYDDKLVLDRKMEMEHETNIDRIKGILTDFFQACKEKNPLEPSSVEISLEDLIAESSAKKPEKLSRFEQYQTLAFLIPAIENIEKQRIEFYKELLTILSSDALTIEKQKRALALKNNIISKMINTLSSYGNDVLDPDRELFLEEIYFGTIHEYEKIMLNLTQCIHCENMRHKQVLSEQLGILQKQSNYSQLNSKLYLAQFNSYSRSFKLSKNLASVEEDSLKLQEIERLIKTAKVVLTRVNTDSDDSNAESKESKEAAAINFGELALTDNACQYLNESATAMSFLRRLYSSEERVTFRELFTFCDALRTDQINTDVENHTGCRLPNIWACDRVAPPLLTLAIPHGRNGKDESIQDQNALSQIRAAFRSCGMMADLIESAQQRHPRSEAPGLRIRI